MMPVTSKSPRPSTTRARAASTNSEANATIRKFTALSATDQQAVIDFLRSL